MDLWWLQCLFWKYFQPEITTMCSYLLEIGRPRCAMAFLVIVGCICPKCETLIGEKKSYTLFWFTTFANINSVHHHPVSALLSGQPFWRHRCEAEKHKAHTNIPWHSFVMCLCAHDPCTGSVTGMVSTLVRVQGQLEK